jgi:hypothetical protein
MNRRTQAYLEIPSRLSVCRTPQDFANEQMRFLRTAYEEYTDSFGRVAEAMTSMAVPSFAFGRQSDGERNSHDYLSFPENEEPGRPVHPRERRAA